MQISNLSQISDISFILGISSDAGQSWQKLGFSQINKMTKECRIDNETQKTFAEGSEGYEAIRRNSIWLADESLQGAKSVDIQAEEKMIRIHII